MNNPIQCNLNNANVMKKYFLLSFVLSCLTLTAFTQELPVVTIVNNTGYTVYYVYMSQVASDDWGDDLMGSEVLSDGESVDIRLAYPLNVTNKYDIKLEDEDGDTYTRWDVLITPDSRIVFTIGDMDIDYDYESTSYSSTDNPIVYVLNNTGYTVYYVYMSQTASDDWGEDLMGDEVLLDGESVPIRLAYPLTVTNRYDIKLEDEDGDTYTLWDVLVSPDSTIEFTIGDLDLDDYLYD